MDATNTSSAASWHNDGHGGVGRRCARVALEVLLPRAAESTPRYRPTCRSIRALAAIQLTSKSKSRKERHESPIPAGSRHPAARTTHGRVRRGEHPLAAHRRPGIRPERSQARPLACRPRPRGRVARPFSSSAALRGRGGSFGTNEVGGAPLLAGCGGPDAAGILPLGPLPGRYGAQRAHQPRLPGRDLAGSRALDPGSRTHTGTPREGGSEIGSSRPGGRQLPAGCFEPGSKVAFRPPGHQFQSPRMRMVAGTSRTLITVASTKTATASPRPTAFVRTMPVKAKAPVTTMIIAAADVMIPAVATSPLATLAVFESPFS